MKKLCACCAEPHMELTADLVLRVVATIVTIYVLSGPVKRILTSLHLSYRLRHLPGTYEVLNTAVIGCQQLQRLTSYHICRPTQHLAHHGQCQAAAAARPTQAIHRERRSIRAHQLFEGDDSPCEHRPPLFPSVTPFCCSASLQCRFLTILVLALCSLSR